MYTVEKDSSVIDSNGKILYFSADRFYQDVVLGDNCFICGKSPKDVKFNNEHILPKWILKKYNLFNRRIGLPNLTYFQYRNYVVPCCVNCNSLMNTEFERPIKKIMEKGFDYFVTYINENGLWKIFLWLNILFLKTHLKDKSIRIDFKDNESENISELYNWEHLHHIHCVARAFYTGVALDPKIIGTILVFKAKTPKHYEHFDYGDTFGPATIFLRLNDIAIIASLKDAKMASNLVLPFFEKISGPLSPLQLREIFTRVTFTNLSVKTQPEFFSSINIFNESYEISVNLPEMIEFAEINQTDFGNFLYERSLDFIMKPGLEELRDKIKTGNYTFIYDSHGIFISDSMD